MIQKSFDAITKEDVDFLIENGVLESKTLEYKETLPDKRDRSKREFLADVSSFANSAGGDILYGVKAATNDDHDKTGAPEAVVPITGETADQAKLRIESMLLTGIEPRIRVQTREVTGWGDDEEGFIVLVRIPKSFSAPHIVRESGKFFARHSSGKYPLDVHELRDAFLATDSQTERIRRFRLDRLAQIAADETPVPLTQKHRLILHIIPLASFLNQERLDLTDWQAVLECFQPMYGGGSTWRYNPDGLLSIGRDGDGTFPGYCQVYFNGTIESVTTEIISDHNAPPGSIGGLASTAVEQRLLDRVAAYLKGMQQHFGITPPVSICAALQGCKGAFLWTEARLGGQGHYADRDLLVLPDILIDNFDCDIDVAVRPILDAIWNAFGYAQCMHYDDKGRWCRGR